MMLDNRVQAELQFMLDEAFSDRSSRRTLMQRALAVGGAAGLAWVYPRAVFGQAGTPEAAGADAPGLHIEDATGDLADEQVLRLAISEPKFMDPGVSPGFDELAIFFNTFDSLTGVDMATGDVVPRCAKSWDISDDAMQYTFHLHDNLKWSNGDPITAHDFEYAWKRIMDPDTLSRTRTSMYPIKNAKAIDADENPMDFNELGVSATDDVTLVVDMEDPTTFFPLLCSIWTYSPVPKSLIEDKGDAWVEAENMISNGPYKMTEWNHDQSIVLELNEHYYGETPTITRAEYTIFPDDSTQQYVSFENDELDIAAPSGPDLERVLADPDAAKNLHSFQQSNCRMMTCDTKTEPSNNADFRRAIYAALDRETIANVILKGLAAPAYNVIAPDIPGNNPDAKNPVGEDAAKAALEASGIDVSDLEIEYTYRTTAEIKLVAEYIQQRIPEVLGIKVKLNPLETSVYSDYINSRKDQPFNFMYNNWSSDYADPSNWHNTNFTTEADNYNTGWSNEEYDDLCDQAVSEMDPDTRADLYRQAEEILVHEAAYIPVYRGIAFQAVKPYVKNLHMQPIMAWVHLRYPKIEAH